MHTSFYSDEEKPPEDLFFSTPEQVATLTSAPSYLVGDLICSLSGQPVLRRTDLVIKGAQNIILSRTHIPPSMPCSFPPDKVEFGFQWTLRDGVYQKTISDYICCCIPGD